MMPKPRFGKENDAYIDKYFYRYLSAPISHALSRTAITPNQLTLLSIILSCTASLFFLSTTYYFLVVGVILINLGHIADTCDGEIARAKNLTSEFGSWFDSISDRISLYLILFSLALRYYFLSGSTFFLIVGFTATANVILIGMISSTKKYLPFMKNHSLLSMPKNKGYMGLGSILIFSVSIFSLLNLIHYFLLALAVLSPFLLVYQIYSHYSKSQRCKTV